MFKQVSLIEILQNYFFPLLHIQESVLVDSDGWLFSFQNDTENGAADFRSYRKYEIIANRSNF